jgi:hypothetical protein
MGGFVLGDGLYIKVIRLSGMIVKCMFFSVVEIERGVIF